MAEEHHSKRQMREDNGSFRLKKKPHKLNPARLFAKKGGTPGYTLTGAGLIGGGAGSMSGGLGPGGT